MSKTLNQLVRDQILAEGPDIASLKQYTGQRAYEDACTDYIDHVLNNISNVELLERISDALDKLRVTDTAAEMATRLGI